MLFLHTQYLILKCFKAAGDAREESERLIALLIQAEDRSARVLNAGNIIGIQK